MSKDLYDRLIQVVSNARKLAEYRRDEGRPTWANALEDVAKHIIDVASDVGHGSVVLTESVAEQVRTLIAEGDRFTDEARDLYSRPKANWSNVTVAMDAARAKYAQALLLLFPEEESKWE